MKPTVETAADPVEIKIVGKSGQISLGKKYAGKTLRLERRRDGTVLLTAVAMIPEHQLWTLEEPHRSRIQQGLAWAQANDAKETDVDTLLEPPTKKGLGAQAAVIGNRIRLDLNSPTFQDVFLQLEATELKQVVASLCRLRDLEWNGLFRHTGFRWERIEHLNAPTGAKVHSLRLSQRIRAIGFRDGSFLRLVSLHPDHDSAYER